MNTRARSTLLFLGVFALPIGCTRGEPPTPSTSPSVSPLPPPVATVPKSSLIREGAPLVAVGPMRSVPKEQLPAGARIEGELERAASWTDRNGENLAVFSRGETTRAGQGGSATSGYLDVQHYILKKDARPKLLRTVKEKVDQCDADLLLSFRDAALSVTDLDHDGIGELTFAYAVACHPDKTPVLKLLMLENGHKYILRGTMPSEEGEASEPRVDPSFATGAPAFLEHAKRSWEKVSAS